MVLKDYIFSAGLNLNIMYIKIFSSYVYKPILKLTTTLISWNVASALSFPHVVIRKFGLFYFCTFI